MKPTKTSILCIIAPLFCSLLSSFSVHAAHSRRRVVVRNSGARANYDRSVTTFDPSGRLLQVEYALQAAARGGSIAAAVVGDTIYVAVISVRENENSCKGGSQKVHRIADHLWLVTAGLAGDARFLASHLRLDSQQHLFDYGEAMTVSQAAKTATSLQHMLTHTGGARPLGVTALILGGSDSSNERRLFRCSAGGIQEDCLYCTAGKDEDSIMAALAKRYEKLVATQDNPADVVEGLVAAVQDGLGYKPKKRRKDENDDGLLLDVWVFRPDDSKRGKIDTTCFIGVAVGDKESMAKVRGFFSKERNT